MHDCCLLYKSFGNEVRSLLKREEQRKTGLDVQNRKRDLICSSLSCPRLISFFGAIVVCDIDWFPVSSLYEIVFPHVYCRWRGVRKMQQKGYRHSVQVFVPDRPEANNSSAHAQWPQEQQCKQELRSPSGRVMNCCSLWIESIFRAMLCQLPPGSTGVSARGRLK